MAMWTPNRGEENCSVRSEDERTLSAWSRYFKENFILKRTDIGGNAALFTGSTNNNILPHVCPFAHASPRLCSHADVDAPLNDQEKRLYEKLNIGGIVYLFQFFFFPLAVMRQNLLIFRLGFHKENPSKL